MLHAGRARPPHPNVAGADAVLSVDRAIRSLTATLPGVLAASSLGWGLLGLRAWGVEPEGAERWLAEAYRHALGRPDAAPRLALLLLAAGGRALSLFRREPSAAEPSQDL
jgi:hypothetical protein